MTLLELEKYRQELTELRTSLQREESQQAIEAMQPLEGEGKNAFFDIPIQPSDPGANESIEEVNLRLFENEHQLLQQVDEVLERIHLGTFGTYLECSKRISKQRLDGLSYARYCISCQREFEQAQRK